MGYSKHRQGSTMVSLKSSFAFEGENCGVLVGITTHQEQKACLTVANNAEDSEEAKLFLAMLGIRPNKDYQEKLRKERKKG